MIKSLLILSYCLLVNSKQIVNINVVSYTTLNYYLVKVTQQIYFINRDVDTVDQYMYIEDPNSTVTGFYDQFDNKLTYRQSEDQSSAVLVVDLNQKLRPKETFLLNVRMVLVNTVRAVLTEIKTIEDHFVKFESNMLYYSLYPTRNYKLYVSLVSKDTEVYSEFPYVERKDNVLFYNFTNVEPLSVAMNKIKFEFNKPIFVIKDLSRRIYLSMFGKIFVQDKIVLENRASRFIGPYDELNLLRGVPEWLYTFLPSSAENIKFYDILGNNSVSQVIYRTDDVVLKYQPRYPLFGSWKYTYVIEYYLPVHEYVYVDRESDLFFLQMRVIDHVISDTFIEHALVKISLPEFAIVRKVTTPRKFDLQTPEVTYYSMSLFGNPTVVLNGSYLIEDNISLFMVKFSYKNYFVLCPVVLMIAYIECIFLMYLFCNRFIYSK